MKSIKDGIKIQLKDVYGKSMIIMRVKGIIILYIPIPN